MMSIQKLITTGQTLMALGLFLLCISCQKEHVEISEPDKSTAITANDIVAGLILKVALKDGSYDNIIDRCSEISIQFPYSIHVRNEIIEITSVEDIETLKLEYFQFRNSIHIIYPVTVIYSDYSESILTNTGDLHKIQNQYHSKDADADIECIDFIYPIEITLYNTSYQKSDFRTIKSDKDLHEVFHDINDQIIAIQYPIHLETSDGNTFTINDNVELEREISKVENSCNEEDDEEFSDEDYPYEALLLREEWKILLFKDTTNETSRFRSYGLDFKADKTVQAKSGKEMVYGTWELTINENLKQLKIKFNTDKTPINWLNQEWEITNTNPVIIKMEAESDSEESEKKLILQASNNSN
ncbi:MAG: hypothetical protein JEZ14_19620 [Marinilabiliaceae bacterium]|nr:hypothetical protein [Marinilabiliaceae bacterium]